MEVVLYDQYGTRMPTARERAQMTPQRRQLRARYDAVQTNADNERHWANADNLSAKAAASPEVRRKFRARSRYEVANNSYARGILLTLANHTIGTGPRLQVLGKNEQKNRMIQDRWSRWVRRIRFAEKLRTMRMAKGQDGETFGLLMTNEAVRDQVKLDLQIFEAECWATPDLKYGAPNAVDGIEFDSQGNPIYYHKLREHPGGNSAGGLMAKYDRIPAAAVIHLFRVDRPGQVRGIPEIAAALPLFAQLRRYTQATLAAAETAADFAAILYSDHPAGAENFEASDPFDEIEIESRMMTTVPYGYKLEQFKAEQPTTTYEMFKRSILQEIARCLNMPFNIAAGDSSSYNYSSGRLDHQTYYNAINIEQDEFEQQVVERVFLSWLEEGSLIPGYLPEGIGLLDDLPHQWHWDEVEDIDPEKTANSDSIRIKTGTLTRSRAYARLGLDVDEEDRKGAASLNCTVEEFRDLIRNSLFAPASPVPAGATRPSRVPPEADPTANNEEVDADAEAAK